MPEGFKLIPIDQPFSYTKKDQEERKDTKYWAHKYCPEWGWSENLPEKIEFIQAQE